MALARVALKNLQQRVCSQSQSQAPVICRINNALLRPSEGLGLGGVQGQGWNCGPLQRFSSESESSQGKEVAVQSNQGGGGGGRKSSKWRSLLPRFRRPSLWKRRERDAGRDLDRDPFENVLPLSLVEAAENMNRLFDNMIPSQIAAPSQIMGRFKETNDSYKLRYDVPGLTKDELKVTIDDGVLRIRGERKVEEEDESEDEYWMSYGYYNTSLVLPDDAKQDDIKAELKDGVLSITIPKTESHGKDVKEVQIQ